MHDHYDQYTKIGLFNAPAPISDLSFQVTFIDTFRKTSQVHNRVRTQQQNQQKSQQGSFISEME